MNIIQTEMKSMIQNEMNIIRNEMKIFIKEEVDNKFKEIKELIASLVEQKVQQVIDKDTKSSSKSQTTNTKDRFSSKPPIRMQA